MSLIIYIFFIFLFFYSGVLLWLVIGYIRTPFFVCTEKKLQIGITVIICARNEEKTISKCLDSILKQEYVLQKIQVILINDASEDKTVQRAEAILNQSGIHYKIISNAQRKGKKECITYAMQFANHQLIVSRDADTFTKSTKWLQSISDFYQLTQADFIIAPVAIANNFGILWAMQAVENNILALTACGSSFYKQPYLCSGANLIFTKTIFELTQGYKTHQHLESGDDILFMEDVKKVNGKIMYLKTNNAMVYTYPAYSFRELINQKARWASKFKHNKNKLNMSLAVLSFLTNLGWLFCFIYAYVDTHNSNLLLLFICFKLAFDFLLLFLSSTFIKNKNLLWFSLPVGCVYPIYACIVGIASLFKQPKWKS